MDSNGLYSNIQTLLGQLGQEGSNPQNVPGAPTFQLPAGIANVNLAPGDFQAPQGTNIGGDIGAQYNQYLQQAYQNLKPYYQKLLADSNNNLNLAMQNLEQDYQNGMRYTQQDLATYSGYAVQDFNNAMQKLGLQFPQEQQQLQGQSNQRGIALTQGADGKLVYGGGGESGTELGQLNSDQQLRKQAVDQAQQRNLQGLYTGAQRQETTTKNAYLRGGENATQSAQQYQEGLNQTMQQQMNQQVGQNQNLQNASDVAQQNKKNSGGSPLANASVGDRQAAWTAAGNKGDLPVGWYG